MRSCPFQKAEIHTTETIVASHIAYATSDAGTATGMQKKRQNR
jgi:hypothetical protein